MRVNQENKSVDMEVRDINYILPAYVRSYLFYSKNEMPEKIVFPLLASVTVQGKEIPIEYVSPQDPVAVEIAKDGADIVEVTPEEELALDEKDDRIKELKEEVLTSAPEDLTRQQEEVAIPDEDVSPAKAAFAELAGESVHEVEVKRYEAKDKDIKSMHDAVAEAEEESPTEPESVAEVNPTTTPPPNPLADRIPKQPPGGDVGPGLGLSDMQARDSRDQTRTARDLVEEPDINEAEEKEYDKPITRDDKGKPVVEDNPSATSG